MAETRLRKAAVKQKFGRLGAPGNSHKPLE